MGSRYALRETEGAIGLDCRRLHDGRVAMFRHTRIHRRTRRDFLERRDTMSILAATMLSTASIGSRPGIELRSVYESVNGTRMSLVKTMFPYLDMGEEPHANDASVDDYDVYFDELDRIEEEERKAREVNGTEGEEPLDPSENGTDASEMV